MIYNYEILQNIWSLGIIGVARNVAKRMPTTAKPSSVKLEKKEGARATYLGVYASPNCNDDYNNDNNHNNYNNRKKQIMRGRYYSKYLLTRRVGPWLRVWWRLTLARHAAISVEVVELSEQ